MGQSKQNYQRTKYACYATYLAISSIFSLPPLLFATFREMYGISYTLLGTLVLVNFCTQLAIDLIFSFFTKYFNVHKTLRVMPLITSLGLLVYAIGPMLCPEKAYGMLLLGTVIFSVSAGLGEVLISPTVAAIPSEHPEKDMSVLHSLYAYGFVSVVVISALFLHVFGRENWMYLTMFWAILPIFASMFLMLSPMPEMNTEPPGAEAKSRKGQVGLILCLACIFLGGAAENGMSNWISVYMEKALKLPKMMGDILGMSSFAILLGIARSVYAKYGKKIARVLLCGMLGATLCYWVVVVSANPMVSMVACALTGLCTSMLWPGTLILMEEKLPAVGVAAYALMAAGGDCGSSVAPQLMGFVMDRVEASAFAGRLGEMLSISAEQIGMKAGMLTASVFPLIGVFVVLGMIRYFKKEERHAEKQ